MTDVEDVMREQIRARCEELGSYRVEQLMRIGGQFPTHWHAYMSDWLAEKNEFREREAKRLNARMLYLTALGVVLSGIAAAASCIALLK